MFGLTLVDVDVDVDVDALTAGDCVGLERSARVVEDQRRQLQQAITVSGSGPRGPAT